MNDSEDGAVASDVSALDSNKRSGQGGNITSSTVENLSHYRPVPSRYAEPNEAGSKA